MFQDGRGLVCGDGERVLVDNPEPNAAHIRPLTLLQRLYSDAERFGGDR